MKFKEMIKTDCRRFLNSILKILTIKVNNNRFKNISLEERFANYNGDNLTKEFEWDKPVGREIW